MRSKCETWRARLNRMRAQDVECARMREVRREPRMRQLGTESALTVENLYSTGRARSFQCIEARILESPTPEKRRSLKRGNIRAWIWGRVEARKRKSTRNCICKVAYAG